MHWLETGSLMKHLVYQDRMWLGAQFIGCPNACEEFINVKHIRLRALFYESNFSRFAHVADLIGKASLALVHRRVKSAFLPWPTKRERSQS